MGLRALALLLLLALPCVHAATVLYVYDELGRLVAEIDPSAQTTTYTYDAAGNLTAVSRNSSAQFRVVAFEPTRGRVGESVTIYGSGFIANPAQNTVSFNGTTATITAATTNTLVVSVPAGTTSGPITVSNTNGSATTTQQFTLLVPPTIAAVTPGTVNRGTTTRLQISGAQLETARTVNFSQAGLTARIPFVPTSTLLTIDLAVAGNVPVGSYPFSVTTLEGTTASGSVTVSVTTSLIGDVGAVTAPTSVHLRAAEPGAPAGNRMSVWPGAVSVHLPAVIPGAPPGNSMAVTQPVSVSKP